MKILLLLQEDKALMRTQEPDPMKILLLLLDYETLMRTH